MEEIIKILEEHNIKCIQNENELILSHNNFFINIEDIESFEFDEYTVRIKNKKIAINVFYKHESIHVTVY